MKGDVVFDYVDFGYTEGKEVLHDIEIFARPGQKVAKLGLKRFKKKRRSIT